MCRVFRIIVIVMKWHDSRVGVEVRGAGNGVGGWVAIGRGVIVDFVVHHVRQIEDVFFVIHGGCQKEDGRVANADEKRCGRKEEKGLNDTWPLTGLCKSADNGQVPNTT